MTGEVGCVKAGGVVTKLRHKMSTAVSIGNSWYEERFLIDLFLKLVCSSGKTKRLVLLKFSMVCVS